MTADEIIVDSFAGGGGASLGICQAVGREPDAAINHDAAAIAMHAANHPGTRHYTEDVWRVSPEQVTQGRPVGLLWASPDCKHFSRAKGSKPVEKNIRSLAWVVIRWAAKCRPRVIILENVREFADWGPLVPRWECRCGWKGTEGQAVLLRKRRRCPLCNAGMLHVDYRTMVPDPSRKGLTFRRFVGRLRGHGYAIEHRTLNAADYGAPTHRKRLFVVARRDGQPIVWPEPTHCDPRRAAEPSLFEQLRPWRTAAECLDWSIPCRSIFDRERPLAEKTQRRIAEGVRRYVLDSPKPFIVRISQTGGNGHYTVGIHSPLSTVTSKAEHLLVAPTLATVGHGERAGQESRALDPTLPMGTITSKGHHALVAAFLAKHFGGVVGVPIDTPLPTTTATPTQNQVVAANLIHLNHGEKQWNDAAEPLRTVTTGNHAALVYSFLTRYFRSAIGQHLTEPLLTVTGKDRFGLVIVRVEGQPYVIVDIGMRMLTPRELARAQGFPDDYVLTGSKTSQVARIGNSVSPVMARALVAANY